jgi:hypothetical protein
VLSFIKAKQKVIRNTPTKVLYCFSITYWMEEPQKGQLGVAE